MQQVGLLFLFNSKRFHTAHDTRFRVLVLGKVSASPSRLLRNTERFFTGRSWQIVSYQSHLQSRRSCTWGITQMSSLLIWAPPQEVSEYTSGAANINKEIFSAANDSFVLHDSRGYRAGEVDNFRKLTEFINDRTDNTKTVGDRLHAIWYALP